MIFFTREFLLCHPMEFSPHWIFISFFYFIFYFFSCFKLSFSCLLASSFYILHWVLVPLIYLKIIFYMRIYNLFNTHNSNIERESLCTAVCFLLPFHGPMYIPHQSIQFHSCSGQKRREEGRADGGLLPSFDSEACTKASTNGFNSTTTTVIWTRKKKLLLLLYGIELAKRVEPLNVFDDTQQPSSENWKKTRNSSRSSSLCMGEKKNFLPTLELSRCFIYKRKDVFHYSYCYH